VTGRYEILDIVSQDEDGVVFQAEDRQTGATVALRRFFPFGAGAGGLEGEERDAYEVAVRRLADVDHPALRRIVDGGTDPVDGMPFLVTEWLEGITLSDRLATRLLSPQSAKALADAALEASQVLSQALGEDSVWVETRTESIVLCEHDGEHHLSFWISPLRWLGRAEDSRSLRPLLQLVEEATGWHGQIISDEAGDGLGGWLTALRQRADDWSLDDARQALHAAAAPPSPPVAPPPPVAPAPMAPPPAAPAPAAYGRGPVPPVLASSRTVWWPWALVGCLFLLAAGFMIWKGLKPPPPPAVATRTDPAPPPPATRPSPAKPVEAAEPEPADTAAAASARAAELAAKLAEMGDEAFTPDPGFVYPEENAQLIRIGTQLRDRVGSRIRLETRIREVRSSDSGKTIYLEFGTTREANALCARYLTKLGAGGMSADALRALVGKRVKVSGTVVNDPSGRIALDLTTRGDIELVDDD